MITKKNKVAVLAIAAFAMVSWAGLNVARNSINASTGSSVEICDNGIDDNGDSKVDGCWDPGNNYQPTGRIYYVSKAQNASDDNPGTKDLPYKTITKATLEVAAGEAVYVMPGIYQENVEFRNAGTPSMPILFKGIGEKGTIIVQKQDDETGTGFRGIKPRSNTIIDNFKTDGVKTYDPQSGKHSLGGYGIQLSGVQNILIKDCIMQQSEKGIRAEEGDRLIVRNSKIQQCEWGTQIGTDNKSGPSPEFKNTLWENVEVYDSTYEPEDNTDGFLVEGDTAYHVFRNCTAHGFHDGGFDVKAHVLIENCKSYDNGWSQGENGSGFKMWRDTTIRNSIAYNNKVNNYLFGGLRDNWKMIGNISYNGHIAIEKRDESAPTLSANTIKISHNIFLNSSISDEIGNAFSQGDHNIFFGGDIPNSPGSASRTVDPRLKNPSGFDFHLTSSSPAIDAGVATVSQLMGTRDFDGNLRKSGQAVDIGPYEYGSTTGGGTETVTPTSAVTRTASSTPLSTATANTTPGATKTTEIFINDPGIGDEGRGPIKINSVAPKPVVAGKQLRVKLNSSGGSGEVSYKKVSLPKGSRVTATGVFYWTPSIFKSGSYNAQIMATDGSGATDTISFDIKVLRKISVRENREINVDNRQGGGITFQVCRNSEYSRKYREIFSFSDGAALKYISEPDRSRCSNYYTHEYQAGGDYLLTLYLCEKKEGKLVNCFPNAAENISK